MSSKSPMNTWSFQKIGLPVEEAILSGGYLIKVHHMSVSVSGLTALTMVNMTMSQLEPDFALGSGPRE